MRLDHDQSPSGTLPVTSSLRASRLCSSGVIHDYAEIIGNGVIVQTDSAGLPYGDLVGLDFGLSIHVSLTPVVKIPPLQVLFDMAQLVNDVQIQELIRGTDAGVSGRW